MKFKVSSKQGEGMSRRLVGTYVLGLLSLCSSGQAAQHMQKNGETWLITISNDAYPTLGSGCTQQFAVSDSREVTRRLRDQNQIVTDDRILAISPDSPDPSSLPEKQKIQTAVPRFLQRLQQADTLIVYLSLRGASIRNPQTGRLEAYFLPSDMNPLDIPKSCLSLAWLREQLSTAAAGNVILLVDSCRAGIVGGQDYGAVSIRDVESEFTSGGSVRAKKNIYAIASSTEHQRSLSLESRSQSVFCHWLCHGLDGAADSDGDAVVTMDELFDFLEREVSLTARSLPGDDGKPQSQTPQRFLLGDDQGNIPVFPLHAEPVRRTLKRLSGQIDALIANHHHGFSATDSPRISVLEFSYLTDTGTLHEAPQMQLRGPLGSFGMIARNILERNLSSSSSLYTGKSYNLVHMTSLSKGLSDVRLPEVMTAKINRISADVDAIVVGAFTRLRGREQSASSTSQSASSSPDRLQLDLKLIQLQRQQEQSPTVLASVVTTIIVNEELWSLIGGSASSNTMSPSMPAELTNRSTTIPRDLSERTEPKPPTRIKARVENLSDLSMAPVDQPTPRNDSGPHPLSGDDTPVSLTVLRKPKGREFTDVNWIPPTSADPNIMAFEVQCEDELRIEIHSKSEEWLAMVAMVDGLNVIGGESQLPTEGRYWLIPPHGEGVLDQWLSGTSTPKVDSSGKEKQEMEGNKFIVVNAPKSLAAQQGLTTQLGEIRLLIYPTVTVPEQQISRGSTTGSNLGLAKGESVANVFPVYRDRVIDLTKTPEKYIVNYVEKPGSTKQASETVAGVNE